MTKNYYRSDYSDKQWKALIDKATELGCQITYSKYGNIVTIDSTDRENSILKSVGAGEERRVMWADHIHNMLQESTDLRTRKVQPKRYHRSYCPTICRSQKSKIYSIMVTMKFSATKSETLFLTPTIAVEQDNSETAIRFALWHGVFSVEVSKSYKTVKAK